MIGTPKACFERHAHDYNRTSSKFLATTTPSSLVPHTPQLGGFKYTPKGEGGGGLEAADSLQLQPGHCID